MQYVRRDADWTSRHVFQDIALRIARGITFQEQEEGLLVVSSEGVTLFQMDYVF